MAGHSLRSAKSYNPKTIEKQNKETMKGGADSAETQQKCLIGFTERCLEAQKVRTNRMKTEKRSGKGTWESTQSSPAT